MLFERTFTTLEILGNARLQLPIFYESPVSLRFETGDPALPIHLRENRLNPKYFRSALWRTAFLYEKIAPFDTLLWVLYRFPDTTTEINDLLARFRRTTHLPAPAEVYQQAVCDADGEPMTRVLLFWDLQAVHFAAAPLLEEITKADFGGFRELSSAVFFLDTTRHLLFHPYDDRGADVVGKTADDLRFLYQDCQNWLLDYDLERMRYIFEA